MDDTSPICDSIEYLLQKLESLDEEYLEIPFISNRIDELKDKFMFVNTLSADTENKRGFFLLSKEIVSDPDLSWRGEIVYGRKTIGKPSPSVDFESTDSTLSQHRKMVGKPSPSVENESTLTKITNKVSNFWKKSFTNPPVNDADWVWRNPGLLTCFVYCSLYPQGHTIIREDLVHHWMAQENFLPLDGGLSTHADKELEMIGNRYFYEMVVGGVFQDMTYAYGTTLSDGLNAVIRSCVMRPVAYSASRRIAAELLAVHDGVIGNQVTSNRVTKYVALHNFDVTELETGVRWLRKPQTLMLFDSHTPPLLNGRFRKSSDNMRVLSLTRSLIKDLRPSSLEQLRYLRLSLDQSRISTPPCYSFPSTHLQTLTVKYPSAQILRGNFLEHLRHFYLTTEEATLHLAKMESLEILELSRCKRLEDLPLSQGMGNLRLLRTVRIFDCPELRSLPDSMQGLICLEELVLHNCRRLDLTKGNTMKALPKLRYLEMIGLPLLFELPRGLEDAAVLEYMMIGNCTRLRRLTDVVQNVVSLQRLCIYKCPNLTALPNGIRSLTQLQSLHIGHCPILVSRYGRDAPDWPIISHIPDVLLHEEPTNTQQKPSSSSYSQEKNPHFDQFIPFFALKSHNLGSSGGVGNEKYDSKDCSRWDIIGLVLKAVFRLRGLVSESRRVQRLYEKEHLKETKGVQLLNEEELLKKTERVQRLSEEELLKETERVQRLNEEELMKQMKLHCCLFPDDYEIERDTLIQLWMAGGLLKGATMEDVGNSYFGRMVRDKFLLSSNLNSLSRKQMYKINSDNVKAFMDELPIIEARDLYKKFEGEVGDGSNKHWHISLVSDNINQTTLFETLKSFNQLRTLLLIRNYGSSLSKVPYEMFLKMRTLHSLDLSGSHIKELPSSIEYVTELRFLDLSFTLVQELPESLGCLLELQTLKLGGCKRLLALPSSTKRLISLRHLEFDVLGQLSSMPSGIGALKELRTLSAFVVGKKKGDDIKELETLNNLSGSFCISGLENVSVNDAAQASLWRKFKLTQLQLKWSSSSSMSKSSADQQHDNIIGELRPRYSSLKELLILYFPGKLLPAWMGDAQLVKLVSIKLIRCGNVELDVALGELPVLKCLHIDQMNLVTEIDDRICRSNARIQAFRKLEELTVDGMFNLKTWTKVRRHDFPVLSKLILRSCPKLKALPFTSGLPSLTHLEISECAGLQSLPVAELSSFLDTLIIEDCSLLKKRYATTGEDWDKIKHVESIWIDLKNMHSDSDSNSDSSDFNGD